MSQKYKFAYDILKHLVFHGETEQTKLQEIIGCSYRTILREIKRLELMNYIAHVRKRPNGGRGRPRNLWKATIFGLFTILKQIIDSNDDVPLTIIRKYEKDLLIFSEWDYLTRDEEIKKYFLLELAVYFYSSGFTVENFEEDRRASRLWSKKDDDQSYWEKSSFEEFQWDKNKLYSHCFGLTLVLDIGGYSGATDYFLSKYIPYCLKNPRLSVKINELIKTEYQNRFNNFQQVKRMTDLALQTHV